MLKNILLIVLSICVQTQVIAKTCQSLSDVNWLLGKWVYVSGDVRVTESWTKASKATYEGGGVTQSKSDGRIISKETLRLVQMSDEVFYIAKVASNNFPVPFKLRTCSKNKATFENMKHDFPNTLTYQYINKNKIAVFVSGKDGKSFKIDYQRVEMDE